MERRYQLPRVRGPQHRPLQQKLRVRRRGGGGRIRRPRRRRVGRLSDPKLDSHELQAAAAPERSREGEPYNAAVALLRENERKIAEGNLIASPASSSEPLKNRPDRVIIIAELATS